MLALELDIELGVPVEEFGLAIITGGAGAARSGFRLFGRNAANVFRTPGGRRLTRHYAFDTGPERNIPVSLVDSIIDSIPGKSVAGGKVLRYDPVNNVTVITGRRGIVSVRKGPPRADQQ